VPIHNKFLEENCEFIKRWLSFNVLTQGLQSFPATIIEHNGSEIFELISFLTGRANFPFRANLDGVSKRVDRSARLYKQYDDLVRQLKTEGALLNHIRPEFLLSYADFTAYIKQLPRTITDHLAPSAQRLPANRFSYLSIDAWTTLFYQILKVYYLSRVNVKSFRAIPGIPPEKTTLPTYVEGSNIYSVSEGILFHWVET
jgi:hypothetical protein